MRVIPIAVLLLSAVCGYAESDPRNRLTFSGGWSRQIGGVSFPKQSAIGLGGSYGYRLNKHVEAEAGLFTTLDPTGEQCSSSGCVDVGDRYYWLPFGIRFIAPLVEGRAELSAGGGGLYEKYTANPTPWGAPEGRHGWGGYFVGSAAVALDPSRHFWLGVTPRFFLANPTYARDRWLQLCGEFSVRFK
jgi:hypothetical protein